MILLIHHERDKMKTLDNVLDQVALYKSHDLIAIYQPVEPFQDEHGTVVAQVILIDDDEVITNTYYSRGWAYWNYLDVFTDDFTIADQALHDEAAANAGEIDFTIGLQTDAVATIHQGAIPHSNPYWQELVVRTAYNAITNADEFANICRNSNFTQEQVQKMIDVAVGAVLQSPLYEVTGFRKHTA